MEISNEKIKQIFQLHAEGKSLRVIALELGLKKSKVGEILKSEITVHPSSDLKNYCVFASDCEKKVCEGCEHENFAKINQRSSIYSKAKIKEHIDDIKKRSIYLDRKYETWRKWKKDIEIEKSQGYIEPEKVEKRDDDND